MPNATEWTPEDVAKGMQDYLICIEMFLAAIIHMFVFPHSEYSPQAVEARSRALNQTPYGPKHWRRLGRKWKEWDSKSAWSGTTNTTLSDQNNAALHGSSGDMEMVPVTTEGGLYRVDSADEDDDYLMDHPLDRMANVPHRVDEDNDVEANKRNPFGLDYFHFQNQDGHKDETYQQDLAGTSTPRSRMRSSSLEPVQSEGSDEENEMSSGDEDSFSENDDEYSGSDSGSRSDDEDSGSPNDEDMRPLVARRGKDETRAKKPGFIRALWDSTIPQDLRDNTVGIIKGDYVVERKTLLHHAATSDSYELFSRRHLQQQQRDSRRRTGSFSQASASSFTHNSASGRSTEDVLGSPSRGNGDGVA